jgi:hypothetical protein
LRLSHLFLLSVLFWIRRRRRSAGVMLAAPFLAMRLMRASLLLACVFALLFVCSVSAVDRNKFRTCKQTAFCQRLRQTNSHRQDGHYRAEVSNRDMLRPQTRRE